MACDLEGVEKAGAGGADVEADGIGGADFALDEAGGGGEEHVRGDRGDDDEVDFFGCDTGGGHGAAGGFGGEVAGGLVVSGDVAFFDAGAGGDPFVGGVDNFGEVVVGEDFFR